MNQLQRSPLHAALAALLTVFLLTGSPILSAHDGGGSGSGSDDGGGNSGRGGGDDDDRGGGDDDDEDGALTLRVNDAIGKPGGTVAIVLRTYAPRPIRQGRASIRVVRRARPGTAKDLLTFEALTQPVRPFAAFLGAVVYSTRNDSKSQASLGGAPDSQLTQVQFESPSGTVNASDGPLAVLRYRLDRSVTPGQTFDIQLDPALTNLVDGAGRPIVIEPRNATLTVRAPSAPHALEAEGDKVEPGETAELGVSTFEPFPISSGRIVLRYNPKHAGGAPVVRMDPRYGRATFKVDRPKPGQLVVTFQSPDKSLNTVPGNIVAVDLPTSANVAIGARSAITLDAAQSYLLNFRGRKIKLKMEAGELEFE
jgi:hypothetical protein